MDVWDRKQRLDSAVRDARGTPLAWHGETGDACPLCHVVAPQGFLLTLQDGTDGCLRCLESHAFTAEVGPEAVPNDLVSSAGQQEAMRQIANEFRQQIKAARRGQPVGRKPMSSWQAREAEVPGDETVLHNGWPTPKNGRERRGPRYSDTARADAEQSGRLHARQRTAKSAPFRERPARERPSKPRPPIRRPVRRAHAPTPLEVLGLSGAPTAAEINAAFRRCALVSHPDHGGSEEAFRKLIAARDALLTAYSE